MPSAQLAMYNGNFADFGLALASGAMGTWLMDIKDEDTNIAGLSTMGGGC